MKVPGRSSGKMLSPQSVTGSMEEFQQWKTLRKIMEEVFMRRALMSAEDTTFSSRQSRGRLLRPCLWPRALPAGAGLLVAPLCFIKELPSLEVGFQGGFVSAGLAVPHARVYEPRQDGVRQEGQVPDMRSLTRPSSSTGTRGSERMSGSGFQRFHPARSEVSCGREARDDRDYMVRSLFEPSVGEFPPSGFQVGGLGSHATLQAEMHHQAPPQEATSAGGDGRSVDVVTVDEVGPDHCASPVEVFMTPLLALRTPFLIFGWVRSLALCFGSALG